MNFDVHQVVKAVKIAKWFGGTEMGIAKYNPEKKFDVFAVQPKQFVKSGVRKLNVPKGSYWIRKY